MVQAWWAAGLAVPAVIVKGFLGGRTKGRKEEELRAMYGRVCNLILHITYLLACSAASLACPIIYASMRVGLLLCCQSAMMPLCYVIRPEEGTDPSFVCERVCTSDRLLRRMGGLSKDPTPNTCVTVCGVGGVAHPIMLQYDRMHIIAVLLARQLCTLHATSQALVSSASSVQNLLQQVCQHTAALSALVKLHVSVLR